MNEFVRPIQPGQVRGKNSSSLRAEEILRAIDNANYVRGLQLQEENDIFLTKDDLEFMRKMQIVVDHIEMAEAKSLNFILPPSFIKSSDAAVRIKHIGDLMGLYSSLEDKTSFSVENFMKASLAAKLKTFIHEDIHRHSASNFQLLNTKEVGDRRSGYSEGSQYRGFNEGLTEMYTQILWHKYFPFIKSVFPEAEKDEDSGFPYPQQVRVVQIILKDVSHYTGTNWTKVFDMFIKGLFLGDKMWMRIVEKMYGPGSLIFLSSISVEKTNDDFFFYTKNPTDRIVYAIGSLQMKVEGIESLNRFINYIEKIYKTSRSNSIILDNIRKSIINLVDKLKAQLLGHQKHSEDTEMLKNMLFIINKRLLFLMKNR